MMRPIPIGDAAARTLARIGITGERVERLFRLKTCGCSARKATLNAVGNRLQWAVIMFLGGPLPLPWKTRLQIARRKAKAAAKPHLARLAKRLSLTKVDY